MRLKTTLAGLVLLTLHAQTEAQRGLSSSGPAANLPNAIVGRVLDQAGRPVAGTLVTLLAQSPPEPNRDARIGLVGARFGALTDARGEYRLEHLRAGSYYPVVLPQNLQAGPVTQVRSGFGITYYPGTPTLDTAKAVTLGEKDVVTADFILTPVPLYAIAGRIVASTGQPWVNRPLGVSHGGNLFGLDSKAVSIRPDGTFMVPNLPSGRYCLSLRLDPAPRDTIPYVYAAKVDVIKGDVTNVEIRRVDMVRATGQIVFPTSDPSFPPRESFTISGFTDECNPGPTRAGSIRPNMTFDFFTWPGRGHVNVLSRDLPPRTLRMTVRHNGVDVTRSGIEFAPGREVSGIEIELHPHSSAAPTIQR